MEFGSQTGSRIQVPQVHMEPLQVLNVKTGLKDHKSMEYLDTS